MVSLPNCETYRAQLRILLTHYCSTTTHLTTAWAESLSHIFGLSGPNKFFEFLVRGVRLYDLRPILVQRC